MSDYLPLVPNGDISVRLSWRRLDDIGVEELCEALMNRTSKVQELVLKGNNIQFEGQNVRSQHNAQDIRPILQCYRTRGSPGVI